MFSNRFVVAAIGSGACTAIGRMVDAGLKGVELIAINTDVQALQACAADIKLSIGHEFTHGLGAGANPEVGAGAAAELPTVSDVWPHQRPQDQSPRSRLA